MKGRKYLKIVAHSINTQHQTPLECSYVPNLLARHDVRQNRTFLVNAKYSIPETIILLLSS